MAATVYFREYNGAAGAEVATAKNGATIQFKSSDDAVVEAEGGAVNPMISPNSGVYRSYEKYLITYLEDLGGSASISNVEIFIDGSTPDDGLAIFCKTAVAYATPLGGGYDAAGAMLAVKEDLFTKTANDPLVLGAGPFDGDDELSDVGNHLVMQMEAYPSSSTGESSAFNLVLRYDEA